VLFTLDQIQKYNKIIQPRKANNAEYSETVQYKYNADQAIDQWRVHLNACVKAKGKHFENML